MRRNGITFVLTLPHVSEWCKVPFEKTKVKVTAWVLFVRLAQVCVFTVRFFLGARQVALGISWPRPAAWHLIFSERAWG